MKYALLAALIKFGAMRLLLMSIFSAVQTCDLDDAAARLSVSIKLALLLEEEGADLQDLQEAREVLNAGCKVRMHLLAIQTRLQSSD
jgi:hypothetical protein